MKRPSRNHDRVLGFGLCLLLSLATSAAAQQGNSGLVVLDGSITGTVSQPPGGVVPAGDGANYLVIEGYGRTEGKNLFHSFSDFSIGDSELARFTTEGGIDHIISRVTGGNESQLFGRLESEASLFLLNPSGVMFGENASVDVNGSFYASTADTLNFADGTQFATGSNVPPVSFSSAPPSSFGFLAAAPAGIEVLSRELCNDCVDAGGTFSIVGGDVLIDGQAEGVDDMDDTIRSSGGSVEIVSVARGDAQNPLVVPLDASQVDVAAAPPGTYGEVRIQNEASINLTAPGSGPIGTGRIVIRGGQFVLAGSKLEVFAERDAANQPNAIDVAVNDSIDVTDDSGTPSIVRAVALIGSTGDVRFQGEDFTIDGGSVMEVRSLQSPNGPSLFVDADQIAVTGTGTVGETRVAGNSTAFINSGAGNGGDIHFSGKAAGTADRATSVSITNGGQVVMLSSETTTAGDIGIATETLTIDTSGQVLANTRENSTAGSIRVDAGGATLSNGGLLQSQTSGQNPGADIDVTGEQLTVRDSGEISSVVTSASVTGDGGNIRIAVPDVLVTGNGVIASENLGQGKGGAIDIVADDSLTVLNEGQIRSQTGPAATTIIISDDFSEVAAAAPPAAPAPREGGDITIQAGRLTVQGRENATSVTQINTITTAAGGQTGSNDGKGGNLSIDAEQIDLLDGGQLRAVTLGSAPTGDLHVAAHGSPGQDGGAPTPGRITIRGAVDVIDPEDQSTTQTPAGIFATSGQGAPTQATGDGGTATVEADIIEISELGEIQSSTFGDGTASDLYITARQRLTVRGTGDEKSFIVSQGYDGDGGTLTILVEDGPLELLDGGEISASTLRTGRAGNVDMTAKRVDVQGQQSAIFSQSVFANSGGGDAGSIRITTGDLNVTDGARIAAVTAGGGEGGAIIAVATNDISIRNGASISAQSQLVSLNNAGGAGAIDLQAANQVEVSDATVTTTTIDGPGGDIRLAGGKVVIRDKSLATAQTNGRGDAGSVTIEDASKFELKSLSRVSAETTGPGNAGRITLRNVDDVLVTGGSEITSESSGLGSGRAGSIEIAANDKFTLKNGSAVTTSTEDASGGSVSIQAGTRVYLLESTVKTNINIDGEGNPEAGAGDINITFSGNEASETSPVEPDFVVINRSTVSANATGDNADAGNIAIAGREVLISSDSVIEATSESGVQGEIQITSPDADVVSQVTPLPTSFTDPSDRLLPPCAARTERTGSFTVQNRASAPPSPDAPLSPSLGTGAAGASPEDFEECSVFEDRT